MAVMAARVDERLAAVFVELADTLVAGYDLMEFLQVLAERCVELLEVDAAGLLLADAGGTLRLVAASTEQARVLELFQVQDDEGPCLDCYRTGQVVVISDTGSAQAAARWPRFAAAARYAGFAGVHAIPMRLRDQVLGTLNLFAAGPAGWSRRWRRRRGRWSTWRRSGSCRSGRSRSGRWWPGSCRPRWTAGW